MRYLSFFHGLYLPPHKKLAQPGPPIKTGLELPLLRCQVRYKLNYGTRENLNTLSPHMLSWEHQPATPTYLHHKKVH